MPGAVDEQAWQPSAILATQTFGDFPDRYHPHVHGLVADGVFTEQGDFVLAPQLDAEKLTELFRHKVLKMLLARGKITRERIRMMAGWNHSGFHVHCGPRIHPDDPQAMENLAAYIVRASFSQTRMQYCPDKGQVVYRSKDGREQRTYDALEWLAAMVSHLPLKGEQLVKYYGHYSNRARGDRLKSNQDPAVPALLDPDMSSKEARRNWSRLIRKIYEIDPLVCGKCQGRMKVVAFIHDASTVRQILEHLGLWLANRRPNPRAHSPPALHQHDPLCQLPTTQDDLCQLPSPAWEC